MNQKPSSQRKISLPPPRGFFPRFLLMLGFSCSFLVAQENTQKWQIKVAVMDIIEGAHEMWLRTGAGQKPVKVSMNIRTFSPAIEFRAQEKLQFYRSAAEAAAKEAPEPLASVVVKTPKNLIVFSPSKDASQYQGLVVPETDFPYGSFRFVNLSKLHLLIQMTEKPFAMKPGGSRVVSLSGENPVTPVKITAANENVPKRVIRETKWSLEPTQRELVLIIPSSENAYASFRHFVDTKEATPEEAP